MSTDAADFPGSSLQFPPSPPPSYERCVAKPPAPRAEYIVSPLSMAALLFCDDEEE
jgi:hypothetical protein